MGKTQAQVMANMRAVIWTKDTDTKFTRRLELFRGEPTLTKLNLTASESERRLIRILIIYSATWRQKDVRARIFFGALHLFLEVRENRICRGSETSKIAR